MFENKGDVKEISKSAQFKELKNFFEMVVAENQVATYNAKVKRWSRKGAPRPSGADLDSLRLSVKEISFRVGVEELLGVQKVVHGGFGHQPTSFDADRQFVRNSIMDAMMVLPTWLNESDLERKKRRAFVESRGHLRALLRDIAIYGPFGFLANGVKVVDTAGTGDSDPLKIKSRRRALGSADVVVCVPWRNLQCDQSLQDALKEDNLEMPSVLDRLAAGTASVAGYRSEAEAPGTPTSVDDVKGCRLVIVHQGEPGQGRSDLTNILSAEAQIKRRDLLEKRDLVTKKSTDKLKELLSEDNDEDEVSATLQLVDYINPFPLPFSSLQFNREHQRELAKEGVDIKTVLDFTEGWSLLGLFDQIALEACTGRLEELDSKLQANAAAMEPNRAVLLAGLAVKGPPGRGRRDRGRGRAFTGMS